MFEYENELENLDKNIQNNKHSLPKTKRKQIKLGLVGFGIVNQAVYHNISELSKPSTIIFSLENQYSQNFEKTLKTDINIITINTNYIPDNYNSENIITKKNNFKKFGSKKSLMPLVDLIWEYYFNNYKGTLIIKSTCNPKLLNKYLKKKYNMVLDNIKIIFWPEFLDARNAVKDFEKEIPLFGGDLKLILDTLPKLKILFKKDFNNYQTGTIQEVMEYKYFRNMLLMNHFIFMNTVPDLFNTDIRKFNDLQKNYTYNFNTFKIAPDGKPGVGGACLPKDLDNFIQSQYNLENKKYIKKEYALSKKQNSLNYLENISNYNKFLQK